MVGKATLGEEWTGEELKARRFTDTDLEESSRRDGGPNVLWPDGIQALPARPMRWRVVTIRGNLIVDSEEKAHSLWTREKPKLIDMWRRELAARRRHNQIVRQLRGDLNAAIILSWAHRTNVGDLIEIPTHVWARDDIPSVFELGDDVNKWRMPNIIAFSTLLGSHGSPLSVKGRVILRQSDIDSYISPPQETAPTPQEIDERPEYTPPYVAFMLRAAREIGLEPGTRIPKETIESWLRENWPSELGNLTKRKMESMATFLRHPEDERGGYFKRGRNG